MSGEPSHIQQWNAFKNRKTQRQIEKEMNEIFGAKIIRQYEENGIIVKVYEAR